MTDNERRRSVRFIFDWIISRMYFFFKTTRNSDTIMWIHDPRQKKQKAKSRRESPRHQSLWSYNTQYSDNGGKNSAPSIRKIQPQARTNSPRPEIICHNMFPLSNHPRNTILCTTTPSIDYRSCIRCKDICAMKELSHKVNTWHERTMT